MRRKFIWQLPRWTTRLRWDAAALVAPLGLARVRQGELLGRAAGLGFETGRALQVEALTEEALKTAAIEGDALDRETVKSSVARRLGLPDAGLPPADRRTEGLVEVLLDATQRYEAPLTSSRLHGWQAALFPTGWSGLHRIEVGRWRTGPEPMQVVSGPIGRERVHFEAPPAERLEAEMDAFIEWWNTPSGEDGLLRAALAHFRFVTVHPFDDGNGRIARALSDMALARDEGSGVRLYSVSRQIAAERDEYYALLEAAQRSDGDLTRWMVWFLGCLARGLEAASREVDLVLARSRFWTRIAPHPLSQRQRKVVMRLLESGPGGFEGGLTNRKYVALTRASRATAQREIAALVEWGVLRPRPGGGRSASYDLVWGEATDAPAQI